MFRRPALALLLPSLVVSACSMSESSESRVAGGPSTSASPVDLDIDIDIDIERIESEIKSEIDRKLKVSGTTLDCPTPTSWEVDDAFQCYEDSPGFPPGIANVTKLHEDGRYSWYITNTCEDQAAIMPTPRAGCVTPSPGYSDMTEEWQ